MRYNDPWRIQDFPRGHQPRGLANILFGIIFAENCMEMKKKWTEAGRGPLPRSAFDDNTYRKVYFVLTD